MTGTRAQIILREASRWRMSASGPWTTRRDRVLPVRPGRPPAQPVPSVSAASPRRPGLRPGGGTAPRQPRSRHRPAVGRRHPRRAQLAPPRRAPQPPRTKGHHMSAVSEKDMPGRIRTLPRNKAGYPVPDFVAWINREPDFRVIKPGGIQRALHLRLCWVCGIPFTRQEDAAFVIGPMCAVNRVSAEPPSHLDCATYSARLCPFLSVPQMTRRERHKPAGAVSPPGIMIMRNPGVALVWVTGY